MVTKKLGITWENENVLDIFIKKHFPDLRKIFSKIQDLYDSEVEVVTEEMVIHSSFSFQEIYKLITEKPNPIDNYKILIRDYAGKESDVIGALTNELPTYIEENFAGKINKIPEIMIAVADWDYRRNFLTDKILSLLALVFQCQMIFQS